MVPHGQWKDAHAIAADELDGGKLGKAIDQQTRIFHDEDQVFIVVREDGALGVVV